MAQASRGTSRLVASTVLMCKLLIIVVAVFDSGSNVVQYASHPLVVTMSVLSFAAIVAALWRPGLGVALAAVSMTTMWIIPFSGHAIFALLVTTASATIAWRARNVVLLGVGYLGLILANGGIFTLHGAAFPVEAMIGYVLLLAFALAVGWTLRIILRRARSGADQIADLQRRINEVRRDERAALADELAHLLVDDLAASADSVDRALDTADPDVLVRILGSVERSSRTALGRLRQLVSTLRDNGLTASDGPSSDRSDLIAAIEDIEDFLVGHGHPVALDTDVLPTGLSSERTGALIECLRVAADHVQVQAPAGSTCTIVALNDQNRLMLRVEHPLDAMRAPHTGPTAMRRAAERIRAIGGDCEVTTTDCWSLEVSLALQPSPPDTASRRPRVARRSIGPLRWVLTLLAAVAVASQVLQTLARVAAEDPRWVDSGLWSVVWLGLGVALWSSRIATVILTVGLAAGIGSWYGAPPQGLLFIPQVILVMVLTATLVSRRPAWAVACLLGWAVYVPLWTRGGIDQADVIAILITPFFGVLPGLAIHHFVTLRSSQLADLARLADEHEQARVEERRQLAGELHDIVAHQLSLIGLQVMGHERAPDGESARRTAEQLAEIIASARADLLTLVTVMREHHDAATADGARARDVTWLTPARTADAVATTLRQAGRPVDVVITGDADASDPTTQRTVSRILREATTNILRYASPRGRCQIEVGGTDHRVEVTVTSPLAKESVSSPFSTGFGLLGLQERAALTGGTFDAGPQDGQWVVHASLPRWEAAPAAPGRGSGMQWRQRHRVDDPQLDAANQHLGPRADAELVGDPRQVLLH